MQDGELKELVLKHDSAIMQLTQSIEHLVKSQSVMGEELKETNKRLEEITRFLAKQQVFQNKLDTMDRELADSFRRVHKRIDEIHDIQVSDGGCGSVKLLSRDIGSCQKDIERLSVDILKIEGKLEILTDKVKQIPKPQTLKWAIALLTTYAISFGVFVIDSLYKERIFAERQLLINNELTKELAKVNRNINVTLKKDEN